MEVSTRVYQEQAQEAQKKQDSNDTSNNSDDTDKKDNVKQERHIIKLKKVYNVTIINHY